MASFGHLAAGLAGARWYTRAPSLRADALRAALGFTFLSFLPDIDVVTMFMGIPCEVWYGHRGATHSPFVAALLGIIAGRVARSRGRPFFRTAMIAFVVTASHGVFDALTDGGSGIGFLWPLSNERFFFPWRPIPVSPVGHYFLSARGLSIFLFEMLFFAPLTIWALWPHRRGVSHEAR